MPTTPSTNRPGSVEDGYADSVRELWEATRNAMEAPAG